MNISKSLLLEAIPNIGVYTRAETEILKKLIEFDRIVVIKSQKSTTIKFNPIFEQGFGNY